MPKLEIKILEEAKEKLERNRVLSTRDFSIKLEGKEIPFLTGINLSMDLYSVPMATISFLVPELEIDAEFDTEFKTFLNSNRVGEKYIKRLSEIEAIQFTKDNADEVIKFTRYKAEFKRINEHTKLLVLPTIDGDKYIGPYNYVMKDNKGYFHILTQDEFEYQYEKAINP